MTAPLLGRAVAARELRASPATLGVMVGCALAAAALGRHLAARGLAPYSGLAPPVVAAGLLSDVLLWRLGGAIALPFALSAAWLVIARASDDEADGWLAPLAAGGASRGEYLLSVTAGVACVVIVAHLLAAAAFVGGIAAVATPDAGSAIGAWVGVPPLVLSSAAYGALCVAVARRRGRALALAISGVLAPAVVLTSWSAGAGAPRVVARLLTLHLPPCSWSARPYVLLQHAAYCIVALALAARLARTRLGRTP